MAFDYNGVKAAYGRIKPYLPDTPLEQSYDLGSGERQYFFKLESLQRVKSFKIRGALNKMLTLSDSEKRAGVATISSGNHGISVSYAASLLAIQNAVVIVPETTPQSKIDKIRYFGAQVKLMGSGYDEAAALGHKLIEESGMTYIDAYYDDPKIYGGQGTIAIEILQQNPDIDTIVCPIGGGGLITGIAVAAKAMKPDIRIIGVQTEACPAMIRALSDKVFYEEYKTSGETICDALVGGVGKLSYEMLGDYLDDLIEVKEETIRKAVRHMLLHEKYVVEGAGAAALAAVLDDPQRASGKNTALVVSGGNIDADRILEILRE